MATRAGRGSIAGRAHPPPVSQHFDVVVGDDDGFVRGWWVSDDDAGVPVFLTPSDLLISDDRGSHPAAG
jgi:hypothetical protein